MPASDSTKSSSSSSTPASSSSTNATSSTITSSSSFTGFAQTASVDTTFASPTGTSGGSSNTDQSALQSSASLYLYTFLATLVLLLGVSAAIVVRSLLLRRRHRRMIEEAIRNGTWIPPTSGRGVRVDISKKPKMFEAYLEQKGKDLEDWDGIMPFAVSYAGGSSPAPDKESLPASTTSPAATTNGLSSRVRSTWRRAFTRDSSPILPMTTVPPVNPTTSASPTHSDNSSSSQSSVRIAVLIAMPSQTPINHHQNLNLEEDDLPHLEFGVTDVKIHDDGDDAGGEARKRSIGSTAE